MPTPVPADTVRCNLVWTLPQDEIAVNTFHFRHKHVIGNGLDWAADMTQRYANLLRDAMVAQRSALAQYHHTSISLARVDAYHLGADGATIDKRTATFTAANAWAGTSSSALLPLDTAVVVTTYGYPYNTYTPQSSRKRGRFYVPGLTAAVLGTNGRNGSAAALVTGWAGVINYMSGRVMDDSTVPVASREQAFPVVLSRANVATYDIAAISVDDLFDTQRRRENALKPTKFPFAIDTTP